MTTVGYTLSVVAFLVVVVGALALGMWALRRHNKQYPRGTRLERKSGEPDTIESKATYLGGGRG